MAFEFWRFRTRSPSNARQKHVRPRAARRWGQLENLETRRLLVGGLLDASFDADGMVATSLSPTHDEVTALALQTDGKLIAVGSASAGSRSQLAIARYNADGTLDATFSGDGRAITPLGTASGAEAVAIQNDGKIVVGGYALFGSAYQFAMVRYNADGSLDATFDGDGIVTTALGAAGDSIHALALDREGRIVVAGETFNGSLTQPGSTDFAVARYNSDGSLDATFGQGGIVRTAIGPDNDRATAIGIGPTGSIIVAGYATTGAGTTPTDQSKPPTDSVVVRYTSSGALDATFSGDGIASFAFSTGFDKATGLIAQSDGSILLSGSSTDGTVGEFLLAKLTIAGALDSAFGTAGVTRTSFGGGAAGANAIAVSEDAIVLAGYARFVDRPREISRAGFAVARYDLNGQPDLAFGDAGRAAVAIGSIADVAHGVAIQTDGRIVAAGSVLRTGMYDFGLLRLRDSMPPLAVDDAATAGSAPIEIDVLANDFDPEGFLNSVVITALPAHGTASVDALTGRVTYAPLGFGYDVDSFRYVVLGNYGDVSNEATVVINEALPPVAVDDAVTRLVPPNALWSDLEPLTIAVLENDSSQDGVLVPSTLEITAPPLLGTLSLNPDTGVVAYTRADHVFGDDSFRYAVRSSTGQLSNEATVTLAVNFAPHAADDFVVLSEQSATFNVLANDNDPDGALDPTSVEITVQPAFGSASVNPQTGAITYVAGQSFDGDSFGYRVRDQQGAFSNEALVTLETPRINLLAAVPSNNNVTANAAGQIEFTNGSTRVILRYETTSLADGLTRYDVYIDDPSDALRSYFLDNVSFSGVIQQNAFNSSTAVDKSAEAANLDGLLGYAAATDSYFFTPFANNLIGTGIADTGPVSGLAQRTLSITAGSGGGSQLDEVLVAQIVAQGDVTVTGIIARNVQNLSLASGENNVMTPAGETITPPTPQEIAAATAFVNLAAVRLLGRGLNNAEQANFQARIVGGATRSELAEQLWLLPDNLQRRVDALYLAILHRGADPTGRDYYGNLFAQRTPESQAVKLLLMSNEYQSTHVSNTAFIEGLYADLLGRAADGPGKQTWLTALASGQTRSQAVDAFLASAEYQTRLANQLGQQLLQRGDGAALIAGVANIPPGDAAAAARALLTTAAFAQQAQSAQLSAPDRALTNAVARTLMGRDASSEDLGSVAIAGAGGSTRSIVVDTMWNRTAHLELQVDGLFRAYLHRPVDNAGRAAYVALLQSGSTLDALTASLLNSNEYRQTNPSNGAFVDALYRDLLGRTADPAGKAAWVAALDSGQSSAAVIQAFLTSDERRLRMIDAIYRAVLGRNSDPIGRQSLLTLWQQGSTAEGIAKAMLASNEYFDRFAK